MITLRTAERERPLPEYSGLRSSARIIGWSLECVKTAVTYALPLVVLGSGLHYWHEPAISGPLHVCLYCRGRAERSPGIMPVQ